MLGNDAGQDVFEVELNVRDVRVQWNKQKNRLMQLKEDEADGKKRKWREEGSQLVWLVAGVEFYWLPRWQKKKNKWMRH